MDIIFAQDIMPFNSLPGTLPGVLIAVTIWAYTSKLKVPDGSTVKICVSGT